MFNTINFRLKRLIFVMLVALISMIADALAQEGSKTTRALLKPMTGRLASLVLPQVKFRDSDFIGAVDYFRRVAERQTGGVAKVPFVLDLPKDFQPRHELTLDLKAIPLREALRYLGDLAGVEFSIESGAVVARVKGASSAGNPVFQDRPSNSAASVQPSRGVAGILNQRGQWGQKVTVGNNIHYAANGDIQPDKSGYVSHRSMSGWSEAIDAKNRLDANCPHLSPCPSGPCGCKICSCRVR